MAIICHCNVVREGTVVKAIRRGATTLDDIRLSCGAAMCCGGCEPALVQLIERHAADRAPAHPTTNQGALGWSPA